jgi:hypothetical protein
VAVVEAVPLQEAAVLAVAAVLEVIELEAPSTSPMELTMQ